MKFVTSTVQNSTRVTRITNVNKSLKFNDDTKFARFLLDNADETIKVNSDLEISLVAKKISRLSGRSHGNFIWAKENHDIFPEALEYEKVDIPTGKAIVMFNYVYQHGFGEMYVKDGNRIYLNPDYKNYYRVIEYEEVVTYLGLVKESIPTLIPSLIIGMFIVAALSAITGISSLLLSGSIVSYILFQLFAIQPLISTVLLEGNALRSP